VTRHLVVVGGGLTGLAAAWEALAHPGTEVTVLESGDRWGGKVRTSPVPLAGGPRPVDEGADMFLTRVPDAVGLVEELGLTDRLTQPAANRARVWIDGELRWFPAASVLGVPLDDDDLAATGLLDDAALAQVRAERERRDPPLVDDVPIGPWLAERFGRQLVDRIVGPLVGGINAGDVERLSLAAVTPQLAEAAREGGSLTEALRRRQAAVTAAGPPFRALLGGTGELVDTLVAALAERGARLHPGTPVERLELVTGAGGTRSHVLRAGGADVAADAVVVAAPAPVAASLLAGGSPEAAAELASIEHSSVTLVTLVYRREEVPTALDGSGFLVPREAGLLLSAASWGSSKWRHWDDGEHVVLRVSAGHATDDRGTSLADADLVGGLRRDLHTTMGVTADPGVVRISRWPRGFAQYTVGHLDRCDRIDAAVARDLPGVRVTGAAFRGLGVPACIRQGREAARSLLA
jgi:oxygen-dependent protoporphyrinogen oxidase